MKAWIYSICFAALVFLIGSFDLMRVPVKAQGIDQQLQNTFNMMVNTTDPTVHMGARRGVISGGSITMRQKMMNTTLWSFQAPSLQMGCGGWDLFSGSFSFISSDQIVAMLRSIASAAVAYAFQLALCTISKDVCNVMNGLWDDLSKLNASQLNSCQIGKDIVHGFMGKGERVEGENKARQILSSTGVRDDDSDGQNQGKQDSSAKQAVEQLPGYAPSIIKGNHIWRALNDQNASNWFGSGSHKMMEQIMSFTGTMIVCSPGSNGCPLHSDSPITQEGLLQAFKYPTLDLKTLIKGTGSSISVKYLQCNDYQECLGPTETEETSFTGTERMILDRLLGPTRAIGDGLIGEYAKLTNPNSPTNADLGLITNGGSYVQMALNLAVRSEPAARMYIMEFSEQIAADVTANFMSELLMSAMQSTSAMEGGQAKEAQELVLKAHRSLFDDLKLFHSQTTATAEKFLYFQQLMNSLQPPSLPATMPVKR